MRSGFEEYYSTKYPNDDCTLMRNGNYSGWLKQQHWEQWQHQQTKVGELQYKAKLRESDHQALLVKYQATKKCWENMSKEKDELRKQRDSFIKAYEIEMDKSIELQKRVDAAIYLLPSLKAENDLWGCDQVGRQIELLEQTLKGDHA